MINKNMVQLIYILLNILPAFPVAYVMTAYKQYGILPDVILYGFYVCMMLFKYVQYCPFKLMARYMCNPRKDGFVRFWNLSYGHRRHLATIVYGGYALFISVLLLLLI